MTKLCPSCGTEIAEYMKCPWCEFERKEEIIHELKNDKVFQERIKKEFDWK